MMRHTISILLENESGALSRVAGLFSARGYNIESLSVAATDDPTLSRMTLVTRGNEQIIDQIKKQLNKLIEVVKIMDLAEHDSVERELLLVKVKAENSVEFETIKRVVDIYRARIIDSSKTTYTVEVTGDQGKVKAFLHAMESHNVMEVVRSGALGIARGMTALKL
ncbi:MAG: Acetolactate synthase small subunit (EC [uncultured Thiotrichaceae bacterium]|uniref:Acetolactate synthase small subunit n=1 Tax=uncultured Thiotrichaceae bacterium TaxID=298394 RepID=A0A6S6U1W9_9GAMM|nr:MAG: Acetolactate synthase small subunit (EC [uncultured Thiotrichaceae bacterium]